MSFPPRNTLLLGLTLGLASLGGHAQEESCILKAPDGSDCIALRQESTEQTAGQTVHVLHFRNVCDRAVAVQALRRNETVKGGDSRVSEASIRPNDPGDWGQMRCTDFDTGQGCGGFVGWKLKCPQ
jgi:hypothetical protein